MLSSEEACDREYVPTSGQKGREPDCKRLLSYHSHILVTPLTSGTIFSLRKKTLSSDQLRDTFSMEREEKREEQTTQISKNACPNI